MARVGGAVLRDRDSGDARARPVRGGGEEDRGAARPQVDEVLGGAARACEQLLLPRAEAGVHEDLRRVLQDVPEAAEGDPPVLHAGVLHLRPAARRQQAVREGVAALHGAPSAAPRGERRVVQHRVRDGRDRPAPGGRDDRSEEEEGARRLSRGGGQDRRQAPLAAGEAGLLRPGGVDEGAHRADEGRRREGDVDHRRLQARPGEHPQADRRLRPRGEAGSAQAVAAPRVPLPPGEDAVGRGARRVEEDDEARRRQDQGAHVRAEGQERQAPGVEGRVQHGGQRLPQL